MIILSNDGVWLDVYVNGEVWSINTVHSRSYKLTYMVLDDPWGLIGWKKY